MQNKQHAMRYMQLQSV